MTPTAAMGLAVAQDPILQFAVQYLKKQGFSLPQDGIAARAWCEEKAQLGVTDAQVTFAELLSLGLFGGEDAGGARSWLQRAADSGHPAAFLMLAGFVEAGSDQEPPNVDRAVALVQSAAEKGYGPALVQLGVMYLNGINVKQDRTCALQYLRKAAQSGDARGQYILGANLLKEATAAGTQEGVRWIQAAAANAFAGAHRHLGYLYGDGDKGLQRDEEKSRRHFFLAAQLEENASANVAM